MSSNNNNSSFDGDNGNEAALIIPTDGTDGNPTDTISVVSSNSVRLFLSKLADTMPTNKDNVLASRKQIVTSLAVISKSHKADADLSTLTSFFGEMPGFPKDFSIHQLQEDFANQVEVTSAKHLFTAGDYTIINDLAKNASDKSMAYSTTDGKLVNVKKSCSSLVGIGFHTIRNWLCSNHHGLRLLTCKDYAYLLGSNGHVQALIIDKNKVMQLFVAFAVCEYENDKDFEGPLDLVTPFAEVFHFTDLLSNALVRVLSRPRARSTANASTPSIGSAQVSKGVANFGSGSATQNIGDGQFVFGNVEKVEFHSSPKMVPTPIATARTPTTTYRTPIPAYRQALSPESSVVIGTPQRGIALCKTTFDFSKYDRELQVFQEEQVPVLVSWYETPDGRKIVKIDCFVQNKSDEGTLCAFDASTGNFNYLRKGKVYLDLSGYALTLASPETHELCIVRLKGTTVSISNLFDNLKAFFSEPFPEPDVDPEMLKWLNKHSP